MKKTLLIIGLIASCSIFSQTNLVLNSTCETHTFDLNDNADSFDMSPPTGIDGGSNNSPYRAIWNNTDLDSWLLNNCGGGIDGNEQPGSSSDGNKFGPNAGTGRGVKIASTCRRLYQVVPVSIGTSYTFSIDSRSEAMNVPSTVYILNTEITDETSLSSTIGGVVDGYKLIDNDFNATKSSDILNTFTTTTLTFTATTTKAVIYVKAPAAIDANTEVFYDNLELYDPTTASVKDDEFSNYFSLYPNPASGFIHIQSKTVEVTKVEIYNLTGQRVLEQKGLVKNGVDVSGLSKGIYVLKLSSADNQFSRKIIVE